MTVVKKEPENIPLCLTSIVLLIVPNILEYLFKITFPKTLKNILWLFILITGIVGKILNFYILFPPLDSILHLISGFLSCGIGFGIIQIFIRSKNPSPFLSILFSISFAITIGVTWEIIEFAGDMLLKKDNQNDYIVHQISSIKLNPKKETTSIILKNISKTKIYYKENGKAKQKIINGYLDLGIIDTMKDLIIDIIGSLLFSIYLYLYLKNRKKYKTLENFIIY